MLSSSLPIELFQGPYTVDDIINVKWETQCFTYLLYCILSKTDAARTTSWSTNLVVSRNFKLGPFVALGDIFELRALDKITSPGLEITFPTTFPIMVIGNHDSWLFADQLKIWPIRSIFALISLKRKILNMPVNTHLQNSKFNFISNSSLNQRHLWTYMYNFNSVTTFKYCLINFSLL